MLLKEVEVTVQNGPLATEEILRYIEYVQEKNCGQSLKSLDLKVDGDEVELRYVLRPVKFQRIRRITGYLVGTVDRWNDAKRCEEADRVKHSCCGGT